MPAVKGQRPGKYQFPPHPPMLHFWLELVSQSTFRMCFSYPILQLPRAIFAMCHLQSGRDRHKG